MLNKGLRKFGKCVFSDSEADSIPEFCVQITLPLSLHCLHSVSSSSPLFKTVFVAHAAFEPWASFEPRDTPASAFQVLGLKASATTAQHTVGSYVSIRLIAIYSFVSIL